nr:exodeoxyribonuclease III [Microbacterium endophyticum]
MSAGPVRVKSVSRTVRIASVNVNGIRAAARKGMNSWLETAGVDILTLQEVRGTAEHLSIALPDWHIEEDEALQKGRAGVAIASRTPPVEVRKELGGDDFDSKGRWIEADFAIEGEQFTVVSAYVYTGEDGTPKQDAKYAFLDAMTERMPQLAADGSLALITGDLNVGHRELDIKNWRGNLKKAGFLRRERAYFDSFLAPEGEAITRIDDSAGVGLGWTDIGRAFHGDVDGPYSWWSNRGQAFDTNTGWRIDYHLASAPLAGRVTDYSIVRAPSWDTRWSDHAPVIADYTLGS